MTENMSDYIEKILTEKIIEKNAPIERMLENLTTDGCPCCNCKEVDNFLVAYIEYDFWYIECLNCGQKFYKGDKLSKNRKPFLKIRNDYFVKIGDEGVLFNLHKPSDIRSLIYRINRMNGFSELQCEYNEEDLK